MIGASTIFAQNQDSLRTQDENELLAILNEQSRENHTSNYTVATFKTTRVANGQSIENVGAGVLDMRINHRFGLLNQGVSNFFGLDNATTRLGFDYGLTDWLMLGVGRSTYLKDYDGFVKVKILRQTDDNKMPLSMSYAGAISVQTLDAYAPAGYEYTFDQKLAYVNQILIARKFSSRFSFQLVPTHIHYNMVQYDDEPNDIFALGFNAKLKLSRRISLTGEYYPILSERLRDTRHAATLGFDIATGGHIVQLLFTNSTGSKERTVIGQTTGRIDHGDIHFGFNISRVFTIVKPKGTRNLNNKIW